MIALSFVSYLFIIALPFTIAFPSIITLPSDNVGAFFSLRVLSPLKLLFPQDLLSSGSFFLQGLSSPRGM